MSDLRCRLVGHRPALVISPCRCLRCCRMIEWDGRGGWRDVLKPLWEGRVHFRIPSAEAPMPGGHDE